MVDADFRNSYDQGYRDALSDIQTALDGLMSGFHARSAGFMADQLEKRIRTLRQASFERGIKTQ